MIPVLPTEAAAEAIIAGIQHNQRQVTAPFMLKFILAQNYLFPDIVRWLMHFNGYKRQPGKPAVFENRLVG